MNITNIDHIVLTVKNISKTVQFYESVLGMAAVHFGKGRIALKFGLQKINFHEHGKEFEPKANMPTPGSEDLCFLTNIKIEEAMEHVRSKGVKIIEGTVERTGANGPVVSFYFRDPDQNLIEVANSGPQIVLKKDRNPYGTDSLFPKMSNIQQKLPCSVSHNGD